MVDAQPNVLHNSLSTALIKTLGGQAEREQCASPIASHRFDRVYVGVVIGLAS
jgi:hypothetical protein